MKKNKKLYGIIGLGRFGYSLAESLSNQNEELIVIDCNEKRIRDVSEFTENAYLVSELSKQSMSECGIQNCDVVFICIGEKTDTSILATLNVLELGVTTVVARATTIEHGKVLEKLGAEVVYPERDMALRISKKFTSSHVMEYISISNEFDITELKPCKGIAKKTVMQLDLRKRFGLNIIAIRRSDETIITDITPDTVLDSEDTIVVCGKSKSINEFAESVNKS